MYQHSRVLDNIVPEVLEKAKKHQQGRGTENVPNGTTFDFTEGWFRNTEIYKLPPKRQKQLLNWFTNQNCNPNTKQVKNKANKLKEKQNQIQYIKENLLNKNRTQEFIKDIENGAFISKKAMKKAVKQANEKYKEKQQHQIIHGNALKELENIENKSINTLITDPPYNITQEEWDQFNNYQEFTEKWINKTIPKIKKDGRIYIFWSQEKLFKFPIKQIENHGFKFGNLLIWNYKNNIKAHNEKEYKYTYEPIFYFYGEKADKLNMAKDQEWGDDLNNLDIFEYAVPQSNFKKDKKIHPTQKPQKLLEQIIKTGTYKGDLILDPFAGSGTTGVAAKKLSRKSIQIEKNKDYVKKIEQRLLVDDEND